MPTPKVVFYVEDETLLIDICRQRLNRLCGEGTVVVISANDISVARQIFAASNDDFDLVVMDGCVPGRDLNTMGLVREIRDAGFTGPMIAASSRPDFNALLLEAGCDNEVNAKAEVTSKIIEILGIERLPKT